MICPRCAFDNLPGDNECRRCLCDLTALDRPMPHDRVELSLMADAVGKLQSRAPVVVPLGSSVARAVRALLDEDIGAVMVVDAAGLLSGIFSERDLLTKVAGLNKPLAELRIDDFMTAKPQTVTIDDKLAFALRQMDVGGYRHLPIVRDGKPVGILSIRDLVRHFTQLCQ